MRPITLGIGLVIAAVAGGAMILSGGDAGDEGASLSERADRVMSSRGQRSLRPRTADDAGPRSMFRSVNTWGGRGRTRFAADAPSRLDPDDRERAERDRGTNTATTTGNRGRDRVGASNARPRDNAARDRLAEARRQSMDNRKQQREMEAQERRLRLQQERLSRLQQARNRASRSATSSRGGVNAQTIRALAARNAAGGNASGGEGAEGEGAEGAPRDPNAPPSMDEIMQLFDAFGIDPSSGGGPTSSGSGSSSSSSGSSFGGTSGTRSSSTGGTGVSGVGAGPATTTTTGNGSTGLEASVSTLWLPVDQSGCAIETRGLRTNDLYIRIEVSSQVGAPIPESIRVVTLNFPGIEIFGGEYHDPDGTLRIPPTLAGFTVDPCSQIDTFISFGESGGSLLAGSDFEDPLVSVIDASLLNFEGVPAARNRSILNDDAFYLRIARITAPTTITNLTGEISVGLLLGSGFGAFASATGVPVAFEPSIWRSLEGLRAVWVPVPNDDTTDCDPAVAVELETVDTFDLFLRRDDPFDLVFVGALPGVNTLPLLLSSGMYYFHPMHDANHQEPLSDDLKDHPCLAFDSFLTVDTSATPESPRAAIISAGWTSGTLAAFWGVPNLGVLDAATPEPALQDPSRFGDDGYYIRIARVSVSSGSTISGSMLVSWVAVLAGDNRQLAVSIVPICDFDDVSCPTP